MVITLKFEQGNFTIECVCVCEFGFNVAFNNFSVIYHRVMHPKDADGMANSVDPDQIAPPSLISLH